MSKPEILFKDLDDAIQNGNFETVLALSNQILQVDANDGDAFQCKLNALINLSRADEALQLLDKNPNLASHFVFERAYAHYKNQNFKEALATLKSIPAPKPARVLHLEAQTHYRLEQFQQAQRVYEQLSKEYPEARTAELQTNLVAAYVSGGDWKDAQQQTAANKETLQTTYEYTYNAACAYIEARDYENAEKYLLLAERVCRESLRDASSEEVQDELSIVQTQLGYIYQLQGKKDEALKLYETVMRAKLSDEGVAAVASNNVVVMKRSHDLFDSFKKLKQAMAETLDTKLATYQKKLIGFNRCLVLLHMNKGEQCKELLKLLQDKFPDSDKLALINASLALKQHQPAQSLELLKEFSKQHPESSSHAQLALAQLQLGQGNVNDAIATLESIKDLRNKPALVATLAYLYDQQNDIANAARVLDQYAAYVDTQQKQLSEEEYVRNVKETANFNLKYKRYKEAAVLFEKVLKVRPTDLEALPGVIISYSHFDSKLAEKYEAKLPPVAGDNANNNNAIDAESLENLVAPRIARRTSAAATTTAPVAAVDTTETEKKKKKKKRKKILPRFYDPNRAPDPERWKPLRERSYYKPKRRKGRLDRGPQGAVNVSTVGAKASSSTTTAPAATPAQPKPTQPEPAAPKSTSSNKKKKKR